MNPRGGRGGGSSSRRGGSGGRGGGAWSREVSSRRSQRNALSSTGSRTRKHKKGKKVVAAKVHAVGLFAHAGAASRDGAADDPRATAVAAAVAARRAAAAAQVADEVGVQPIRVAPLPSPSLPTPIHSARSAPPLHPATAPPPTDAPPINAPLGAADAIDTTLAMAWGLETARRLAASDESESIEGDEVEAKGEDAAVPETIETAAPGDTATAPAAGTGGGEEPSPRGVAEMLPDSAVVPATEACYARPLPEEDRPLRLRSPAANGKGEGDFATEASAEGKAATDAAVTAMVEPVVPLEEAEAAPPSRNEPMSELDKCIQSLLDEGAAESTEDASITSGGGGNLATEADTGDEFWDEEMGTPTALASPVEGKKDEIPGEFSPLLASELGLAEVEPENEKEAVRRSAEEEMVLAYAQAGLLERVFSLRLVSLLASMLILVPLVLLFLGGGSRFCPLVGRTKYQLLLALLPITATLAGNRVLQSNYSAREDLASSLYSKENFGSYFKSETQSSLASAVATAVVVAAFAFSSSGGDAVYAAVVGVSALATVAAAAVVGTAFPLLFGMIPGGESGGIFEQYEESAVTIVQDTVGGYVMIIVAYLLFSLFPLAVDPQDVCTK